MALIMTSTSGKVTTLLVDESGVGEPHWLFHEPPVSLGLPQNTRRQIGTACIVRRLIAAATPDAGPEAS